VAASGEKKLLDLQTLALTSCNSMKKQQSVPFQNDMIKQAQENSAFVGLRQKIDQASFNEPRSLIGSS